MQAGRCWMVANVIQKESVGIENESSDFSFDKHVDEFLEAWPKADKNVQEKRNNEQTKGKFKAKSLMTQDGWKEIVKPKTIGICAVRKGVKTEVTVDSAVAESVCPKDWAQEYET